MPKGFNPAKDMERYDVKQSDVEFLHVADLRKILASLPHLGEAWRIEGWEGAGEKANAETAGGECAECRASTVVAKGKKVKEIC